MCSSRSGVANADNESWSLYGAQRSQLVATGRKWEGAENGSRQAKAVAVGCDPLPESFHGKEGSTVRVRQKASGKPCKWACCVVPTMNVRTQNGHICGTCDAARRLAAPVDTLLQEGGEHSIREIPCSDDITVA
jgi:hypothetical protein